MRIEVHSSVRWSGISLLVFLLEKMKHLTEIISDYNLGYIFNYD